jgi:hypothetical protein
MNTNHIELNAHLYKCVHYRHFNYYYQKPSVNGFKYRFQAIHVAG